VIGRPKRGGQRWALSILLHVTVLGVVFGGWYWSAHRPRPVQSMGIEARVVSGDALTDAVTKPPEPPPVSDSPEPEPEAAAPEPEQGPTPEEVAAQAAAAEQVRVAEERRLAEEREVAERKAAADKAERDRKDKERKEKEKAARDKAAKEKAERERLAREQAEKAAAEKARKQREDELAAQIAAEDRLAAARASGLQNEYIRMITAKIESKWKRPPAAQTGIDCEVRVTQVPGGVVTGVQLGRCNADEAVRQSIENAVYGASPLPEPPDPALFDRNLRFNFRPSK
jgi:colicin import membrane protein